jgi:hypothetical protein
LAPVLELWAADQGCKDSKDLVQFIITTVFFSAAASFHSGTELPLDYEAIQGEQLASLKIALQKHIH